MATMKKINFGGKTLNVTMNAKNIVKSEQAINKSLLLMLMNGSGMNLPKVGELLTVLHECNSTPNVKLNDMIDLYDKYLEDGNSYMDLLEIVTSLLEDSGFFPKEQPKAVSLVEEVEVIEDESPLI